MKPTHFRPHVGRNPLSFSDDPFDPWRPRTSRAGEFRSPRAVGNLPAKRSASQDSTNGPIILGLSAESLERVEVCIGDCPTRDRPRLAKEAFQTTGLNYPGTRIQAGLGRTPIFENWLTRW